VEFVVTRYLLSKLWSAVPKAIFIVRQHGHVAWGDGQTGKREDKMEVVGMRMNHDMVLYYI
jgi:hypothetical protein